MYCSHCGSALTSGSKFCTTCGNPVTVSTASVAQPVYMPARPKKESFSFFGFLTMMLLKPVQTWKEKEAKLHDPQNGIILSLIVTTAMTILNVIKAILQAVIVRRFSWLSGSYHTSLVWENIGKVDWLDALVKHFFFCLALIFVIALIFYLTGLILKKKPDYMKLVALTSASFVPIVLTVYFLSGILSLLYVPLALLVSAGGVIYGSLVLGEGVNDHLQLEEGNMRIYVHTICFTIMIALIYLVIVKFLTFPFLFSISNF